jgi:hypothetical protein
LAAKNPGRLRPELARAQQTLETALHEACASDVKEANTAELIRIDESLVLASAAAKEAISVRQQIRREHEQSEEQKARESHRRFDDAAGVLWDAFAVYPSEVTAARASLPDPFRHGWLSFDSGTETRRLAPIPDGWKELSEEGLRLLCAKAEIAPRRKH